MTRGLLPGLKDLAGLKDLQELDLSSTQVTDVGLMELAELKNLKTLNLGGTKVTEGCLMNLRKALPGCRIYH